MICYPGKKKLHTSKTRIPAELLLCSLSVQASFYTRQGSGMVPVKSQFTRKVKNMHTTFPVLKTTQILLEEFEIMKVLYMIIIAVK